MSCLILCKYPSSIGFFTVYVGILSISVCYTCLVAENVWENEYSDVGVVNPGLGLIHVIYFGGSTRKFFLVFAFKNYRRSSLVCLYALGSMDVLYFSIK